MEIKSDMRRSMNNGRWFFQEDICRAERFQFDARVECVHIQTFEYTQKSMQTRYTNSLRKRFNLQNTFRQNVTFVGINSCGKCQNMGANTMNCMDIADAHTN